MSATDKTEEALLTVQVGGGNPSDDEMAAVLAVLQAATSASGPVENIDDRPLAGGWNTYHRVLRRTTNPGREAWRYSARP